MSGSCHEKDLSNFQTEPYVPSNDKRAADFGRGDETALNLKVANFVLGTASCQKHEGTRPL